MLDPDFVSVSRGARRHPGLRFVRGRGEAIPFRDGSFERLTAIRSTHHMDSPERFLREASRVLSGNGRIVLEEIRHSSLLARLFGAIFRVRRHGSLDFRSLDDWAKGLRDAGFVEVKAAAGSRGYFVSGRKPVEEGSLPPSRCSAHP